VSEKCIFGRCCSENKMHIKKLLERDHKFIVEKNLVLFVKYSLEHAAIT
jgi:hypothetical protein